MSGKELKDKLKELGVSFTDLSKKLGLTCSQNLYSLLDAGDVKSGTIESISKALSRPVSWFYGETAPQTSDSYLLDHISTQKAYIELLKNQIHQLQKENDSLKTKKSQGIPETVKKYD